DELSGSGDGRRIDERLETGQLDLCEAQFEFFGGKRGSAPVRTSPQRGAPLKAVIIADPPRRPRRRRPARRSRRLTAFPAAATPRRRHGRQPAPSPRRPPAPVEA